MRPAFSRSASAKTMHALLPPSSSVTRLIGPGCLARDLDRRPRSSPVKPTLPTSGCSTSASPTALPGPGTTLSDSRREAPPRARAPRSAARRGGEARRLEHDRVPRRERRRGLPVADVEGEVPRRDERRDADRLTEREHDPVAVDGDRGAEELVDRARVVAHHGGGVPCAPAGVADRHAHVAGLDQASSSACSSIRSAQR